MHVEYSTTLSLTRYRLSWLTWRASAAPARGRTRHSHSSESRLDDKEQEDHWQDGKRRYHWGNRRTCTSRSWCGVEERARERKWIMQKGTREMRGEKRFPPLQSWRLFALFHFHKCTRSAEDAWVDLLQLDTLNALLQTFLRTVSALAIWMTTDQSSGKDWAQQRLQRAPWPETDWGWIDMMLSLYMFLLKAHLQCVWFSSSLGSSS